MRWLLFPLACVSVMLSWSVLAAQEAVVEPVTVAKLPEVPADMLEDVRIRVLDVRTDGNSRECYFDADARLGIVIETAADRRQRYALWNIAAGKLERFLSGNVDQGTTPYEGQDDADFGAEIDFPPNDAQRFAFSTDGKLVAVLTNQRGAGIPGVPVKDEIVIWECASGKLLRRILTSHHHSQTFFFVDEKRLVAKAFSEMGVAVELIDATTGEVDHLIPPVRFEMYAGAARAGSAVFMMPGSRVLSVNLETKEQTTFKPAPPGASNFAAERCWFSNDSKRLFLLKHNTVEEWDVENQSYRRAWLLVDDKNPGDKAGVATAANLVAIRRQRDRQLDFVSVDRGEVQTSLRLPWDRVELTGLSRDGRRLLLASGNRHVTVLDFPDGLPAGEITVLPLLKNADGKALR